MAQQHKTPPATVSKTVQRLLAQIHAEAEAATLAALSAKDGIVTLQAMPAEGRRIEVWAGSRGFSIEGTDGSRVIYTITHGQTSYKDRTLQGPRWAVHQELMDGHGKAWSRYHGFDLITDDFGNLVAVEGGAA